MPSPEAIKTLLRSKDARDAGMREAMARAAAKEARTPDEIAAEQMAKLDKNIVAGMRGKRNLPVNWKMYSLLDQPFAMTNVNRSIEKDDATLEKGEHSQNKGVRRRYAKVKAAEDARAEGIRRRSAGFHIGGNRKLRAEDRRA